MIELHALIALNAISGLGNRRIKQLMRFFGSAKSVFGKKLSKLVASKAIPSSVANNIVRFDADGFLKEELRLIEENEVNVIALTDKSYPENLKEIPDAPVILYAKGDIPKDNGLCVSIVGSRRASIYGISTAERFANDLAQLGITVVSGMARGIDAAAHRGSLRAGGKTVAVLGSGLANIYPLEHKKLFNEISKCGSVISEFSMKTRPSSGNFPRRNRIISGLSLGVVVVEAAKRSGALITSDFALEQGREVFAIPGKVDSPTAQGVNSLIKQGAKLISTVDDIIDELKLQIASLNPKQKKINSHSSKESCENLTDEELRIYNALEKNPIHIDEISRRLKIPVQRIMPPLLNLELRKFIRQSPGKLFARNH